MLVQPQHAATVCELDLVRHASGQETGSGLNPNTNSRRTAHEPLNPTLDFNHAHVSRPPPDGVQASARDPERWLASSNGSRAYCPL